MSILEVKQLSLAFQTRKNTLLAVDDVSFSLNPGETLALLGESGCGKSLTSLAIMRLLSPNMFYSYDSKINFKEQDILDIPEYLMQTLRGRRLAMVFQEPMTALNPVLTIKEQLREAILKHQSLSSKKCHARMIELLEDVEMPDPLLKLNQYPHQLSGGQKQRVVIAMALAHRPDVLIADEPTTALDVSIQVQILQLLQKLQCQYQMSLLLITHDLGVVKMMAQKVCVMYAGQVVEAASKEEFFEKPLHPYVQQLLVSVPTYAKRQERLQSIQGSVPSLNAMPSGCRFHPRCAHVFSPCASVVPLLQTVDGREVRCHLYPEHRQVPPLNNTVEPWNVEYKTKEVVLSVNHLSVYFDTPHHLLQRKKPPIKAVDDISFHLYQGQTLALVGESGCGKTTVSRAILKLQPITKGEIVYRTQSINALHGQHLQAYRNKIQMIFQDPFSSMNPRMTIGDILAEGMQAKGMSARTIQQKQIILLDQVGLTKQSLHRYPHQFSGGQRQRICIARALAKEPEILVCDEPTSALDISIQAQILNLLKELQQTYQLTYLFITHNMGIVAYMADEILVMQHGKMVEMGSDEQILKYPQKSYTKDLLAAVLE